MLTPGDFLLLGAAGKMGQGIAELLQEVLIRDALLEGRFSRKLILIDPFYEGLIALRKKLLKKARSLSEKEIVSLRKKFLLGVSNQEIVTKFLELLSDQLLFQKEIAAGENAKYIFEAAKEDEPLKLSFFQKLPKESFYFTNTSSIPIHRLEKPIPGRIAGLHFYNPPPHQPIVEVVFPKDASPELSKVIDELLKGWKKEKVEAPDIPGFIGNGFLLPELEGALKLLPKTNVEALNDLTREKLFRPMGIFELADFVGRDVLVSIAEVMGKERFPLILSQLSSLPISKKGGEQKKTSEEEAINKVKEELRTSALLKEYLQMSKQVCLDLMAKGVEKKGLEKVLKGGFRHTFVPWDRRLEA